MITYTVDAVALLAYLVDGLPQRANRLFSKAEAGETRLYTPHTAVAETLYAVSRNRTVRGADLSQTPEAARQNLLISGPVSVISGGDELKEYVTLVNEFDIHDAFVVATHRASESTAIVTTDEDLRDSDMPTVWR